MDKELKEALYKLRTTTHDVEIYSNKMIDLIKKSTEATKEATKAIQEYLEIINDKDGD